MKVLRGSKSPLSRGWDRVPWPTRGDFLIQFQNVSKVYNNGTEALHSIDLKVEKGEFVFIVGSSGAGKSTFLKLITCEERPSSGQIILDGMDISRIRKGKIPYVRRKMGMVFQDFRLIDHMTVYDNVAFAMRVVGASPRSIKKRVPYILSLVGLQHKAKHYPTELSGGERQRVGLARALVNNPEMIIADEPTGNIDPALSFEIVDLLNEINRRGTTVLMVTHEHSLVKHFHKRIIQIHSGQIVADTNDMADSYAPPEEYAARQAADDDYAEYDGQEPGYEEAPQEQEVLEEFQEAFPEEAPPQEQEPGPEGPYRQEYQEDDEPTLLEALTPEPYYDEDEEELMDIDAAEDLPQELLEGRSRDEKEGK